MVVRNFSLDEFLEYLDEWKSSNECKERFKLSDISAVHLLKRLRKMKLIEVKKGYEINEFHRVLDGRVYFYKARGK